MSNVPSEHDKAARRGPEGDYRFDYFTFALLALGVALAIIEIARRYVGRLYGAIARNRAFQEPRRAIDRGGAASRLDLRKSRP